METQIVECVPNFSEGRNRDVSLITFYLAAYPINHFSIT